ARHAVWRRVDLPHPVVGAGPDRRERAVGRSRRLGGRRDAGDVTGGGDEKSVARPRDEGKGGSEVGAEGREKGGEGGEETGGEAGPGREARRESRQEEGEISDADQVSGSRAAAHHREDVGGLSGSR